MSAINAQVEDPRINDIRNSVAQNTDAIPFIVTCSYRNKIYAGRKAILNSCCHC